MPLKRLQLGHILCEKILLGTCWELGVYRAQISVHVQCSIKCTSLLIVEVSGMLYPLKQISTRDTNFKCIIALFCLLFFPTKFSSEYWFVIRRRIGNILRTMIIRLGIRLGIRLVVRIPRIRLRLQRCRLGLRL